MAKRKKSRTPAPPRRPAPRKSSPPSDGQARPVQAPQVRTGKRRTEADRERRSRMILYGVAGAGILGLVVAGILVFTSRQSTAATPDNGPNVDFSSLPGLLKTPPPWGTNTKNLTQRLKPLGLNQLSAEGQVLHIHEHLDIFVDGKQITIPRYIGIKLKPDGTPDYLTELHTHNNDGVIHLESQQAQSYSLGQFFGVWGVYLAGNCVGGVCSPPGPFKVYVNGKLFKDDPVTMVLQEHQEIAIVYGKPPAHIPSSYSFAAGE